MRVNTGLSVVSAIVVVMATLIASAEVDANLRSTVSTNAKANEQLSDRVLFEQTEADRCTTIIVGPKAGIEGPMTTHTADCLDCDFRVAKVPAQDWPEGTMRPLYIYRGPYPSVVSPHRGATWQPENLEGTPEQLAAWGNESLITGYIPQVAHTYALYEGGYAIMNEHQVAIGESTCAAKFYGVPVTAGGKARIEVAEMTKIALERSTTARQAIKMMGDLATELGFYAADWVGGDASKGEGGEALTVIDKTEAWVFHVTGDDTGASAVWVAQRVPDDHVAVVANSFVIREIDPDSEDFMHSANIFSVAERNHLWSRASGEKLDFLATYAPQRSHPEYANRRVWRTFDLVAPSLNLPGETNPTADDYPFSVKADKVLTPEDLMTIFRDHYEGTPYDMTQGLAAGPYGDPSRWDLALNDNMTRQEALSGGYERAISMFRTSYSFVALSRAAVPDQLAMIWYGQYNPASSSYAPFYLAADRLPATYTTGNLFNFNSSVMFWNFLAAGNYAGRYYKFAMQEVKRTQDYIHTKLRKDVAAVELKLRAVLSGDPYSGSEHGSDKKVVSTLTSFVHDESMYILKEWQQLLPRLITQYHDGMIAMNRDQPMITMKRLFYPKWWLQATGYFEHHGTFGPDTILFAPGPTAPAGSAGSSMGYYGGLLLTALLSAATTVAVTMWVLQNQDKVRVLSGAVLGNAAPAVSRHEYTPIASNAEL